MDKILILSMMEYGSLIDQVKWTEYLRSQFNILHLSKSKENEEFNKGKNIKIKKIVPKGKNPISMRIDFIRKCRKNIKAYNPELVIMDYFPGCALIKIFNNKKMIMDIRTSTISKKKYKIYLRDWMIKLESIFFDKITIISSKIIKKLNLNEKKCIEIPLGATCVVSSSSLKDKRKNEINLLYVGTFNEREIEKTIYAVKKIIDKRDDIKIKYTIIGFANDKNYERRIKEIIKDENLTNNVFFIGKVSHDKLKNYYELNNIGVSFIPIKEHFDLQPPTKTYEYILNGLFCLATETTANKEIVNEENGILIKDNIDSIVEGIENINSMLYEIDYYKVSKSLKGCTWENIVLDKLVPTIKNIISN